GPVIDAEAEGEIAAYIAQARAEGRVLKELTRPADGHFIAPTVIRIEGIAQLKREIFGPVLHIATFRASEIDRVIDAVNATGYGLTFGLHTRIDDRVQQVVDRLRVGNTYVNRNQIGAVVGSQPFGGEGLSGTGPKAGGPEYLGRFTAAPCPVGGIWDRAADPARLQAALGAARVPPGAVRVTDLPGPTGESNRLSLYARAPVLCLGPGAETVARQVAEVQSAGGVAVAAEGALPPAALSALTGFSQVLWWGGAVEARGLAQALAQRQGAILPLVTDAPDAARVLLERHVCIDTTASGGNAQLLAEVGAA
ncbi:MAG: aldehyde dehydrogenase family protein, partial [Paracoccaceae bacterium]|nr:aldehyde dehydrogenase family protein [Paracoccaceae bacterium]